MTKYKSPIDHLVTKQVSSKSTKKLERTRDIEQDPYTVAKRIHAYLYQEQPWVAVNGKKPIRLLTLSEEELNFELPLEYRGTVLGNLHSIISYAMEDRFRSLPEEATVVFYKGTQRRFVPDILLDGLSHYQPFSRGGIIETALSPLPGGITLAASHTSAQNSATVQNGSRTPLKEGAILETILPKGYVRPFFGCVSYGVVVEGVPLSAVTGLYLPDRNGKWVRFRVQNGEIKDTDPNHLYNRVQTSMPLTFSYNPKSTLILRDDLCQEPSLDSKLLTELSKHFGPLF